MRIVQAVKGELNHIAGEKLLHGTGRGEGPYTFLLPDHEIIKIGHAAPRRGFIIAIHIVPAKGWRVVHDAAAGQNALGDEAGTVSPQLFIIVKKWISPVGPTVGILKRSWAVIGSYHHNVTPLSFQLMQK